MINIYIKFIKEKVKFYCDYFISIKVNYNLKRLAAYFYIIFDNYLGTDLVIKL